MLVQEFGRAVRKNDSSDGIILVNERVDDQCLIYWTRGYLSSELKQPQRKWNMKYVGSGLQAGTCLRKT